MTTKFYSFWIRMQNPGNSVSGSRENVRQFNNEATMNLANELNTVLGDYKLISLTSAATNGIIVTTISYEEPNERVYRLTDEKMSELAK
jgi:hypothetical protein